MLMNEDTAKILIMIPARLGSSRLKRKNLLGCFDGCSLLEWAIKRAKAQPHGFVVVNSESDEILASAHKRGVGTYKRPDSLGSSSATSEDFIYDILQHYECEWIVQLHTISPLLKAETISQFCDSLHGSTYDSQLSFEAIKIECAMEGSPINFSFDSKTNSQQLIPIQRISWSISAWRRESFLSAKAQGQCATYAGNVSWFEISPLAAHVIKTEEDLRIAEALYPLVYPNGIE